MQRSVRIFQWISKGIEGHDTNLINELKLREKQYHVRVCSFYNENIMQSIKIAHVACNYTNSL